MTQSPPKDKSREEEPDKATAPPPEEDGFAEVVETVAAAYFRACRKVARLLNRKKG